MCVFQKQAHVPGAERLQATRNIKRAKQRGHYYTSMRRMGSIGCPTTRRRLLKCGPWPFSLHMTNRAWYVPLWAWLQEEGHSLKGQCRI